MASLMVVGTKVMVIRVTSAHITEHFHNAPSTLPARLTDAFVLETGKLRHFPKAYSVPSTQTPA